MELPSPMINSLSMKYNFANELGLEKTVRFLTNISGLWFLHQCKKSWDKQGFKVSFEKLSELAAKTRSKRFRIDVNDDIFSNTPDPMKAIDDYCIKTEQEIPKNYAVIVRAIYNNLARKYKFYIEKLEKITAKKIKNIHMVGGGSQSETLCQLVADTTGKKVIAGPENATAFGNIIAQLMAKGEIKNLNEGRQIIRESVHLRQYEKL